MCTCTCLSTYFQFFWVYTRSRIAGSCGNSMFKFLRNCQTIFHCGWTTLYPHQQYTGVQFLFILTNVCCFLFFFFNRPSGYEIVSHYGFDLFPRWLMILNIFSYTCIFGISLREKFLSILKMGFVFLLLNCVMVNFMCELD